MLNSLSFHRIKDVEIETYTNERWIDLDIRNSEGEQFTFCMFAVNTEGRNLLLQQLRDASIKALNEVSNRNLKENGMNIDRSEVAEVDFNKRVGGVVIAVTADSDIRYERITARGSVKDDVSKRVYRK